MKFFKYIGKTIGSFIILIIVLAIFIYFLKPKWGWFNNNSAAIQAITGIYLVLVTMLYVIYTKNMVDEMYKSRKQARQPFLRLQWYQRPSFGLLSNQLDTSTTIFQLVNVGDGPAIDVTFLEFECCNNKWTIDRITAIGVNGCADIGTSNIICNGMKGEGTFALRNSLNPEHKNYKIVVKYKNTANETFETEFVTDKEYNDKFRIVKWPKNFI